ncbi:MAG: hypothetical protein N3E52_00935 [Candidatus Bathyarchaeota archaeon]|nr:hypothetical protein [Candidatus Bathyarchaeota archaeon]
MNTTVAEIRVGVKKGDWIEYRAAFTGTPPAGHEVTWARTEVLDVQGTVINLQVTTKFSNGTLWNETITLNLATGQLGDEFIIPSNLNVGDAFFDKYHGNVTISKIEEKTYSGAVRKVISATAAQSTYYWDQATGVLVEGISEFPEYTIHSIAEKTNMWQPQIFSVEPTVFYTLTILVVILMIAALAILTMQRKKKH